MNSSWPGYELRKFEHYKTTWVWPKSVDLTKGGIPLTTGDSFSPELQELLGPGNTTYIHGLEGALLVDVFEALMEREANAQYRNGNSAETITMFTKLEMLWVCEPTEEGKLCWQMRGKRRKKGGWVDLIQDVFNLSHVDALATLARIVGASSEYLQRQSSRRNLASYGLYRRVSEDIPEVILLPHRPIWHRYVELVYRKDIYNHAQELIGANLEYNFGGQKFCVPATVFKGRLCIGMDHSDACLMNQNLIDKYPGSRILIFQDVRSAFALERLLCRVCGYDPADFVVSSHLGDNLAMLPWNYLRGHDVILIPTPSKVDMSRVRLYKEYISGAGANSFRVYPGFLLHNPPGAAWTQARQRLSPLEADLLRDTLIIDDIKMPLDAVTQIIEKAIPYDDYKGWGEVNGIFKRPKESGASSSTHELPGLPPPDPSEIPPTPKKQEDVVLHHFIRPGSNVLVLGAKNAGKTQFALSVCQALRKQGILCSRFHNEANVPCKVAYVDAETPLDEFQANLKRYQLNNDDGFFGLSKFGERPQGSPNSFSLINQEFRDWLREFILKKDCRYVVLDNLTALMGNNVDYGSPAQEVIEWIEQLQINNICAVLIHHKTDSDAESTRYKGRGSRMFNIRARNVIELIGKDEILKNPASETIKTAALQEGLTIGIRFKTCKAAGLLDGKTFYAHLPLGVAHWQPLGSTGADGKAIDFPVTEEGIPPTENAHTDATDDPLHDKLKDLSPDKREVVKVLKAGTATRAQIQNKLGWGEGKTQNLLNELGKKGLITRHGASCDTYYALNISK